MRTAHRDFVVGAFWRGKQKWLIVQCLCACFVWCVLARLVVRAEFPSFEIAYHLCWLEKAIIAHLKSNPRCVNVSSGGQHVRDTTGFLYLCGGRAKLVFDAKVCATCCLRMVDHMILRLARIHMCWFKLHCFLHRLFKLHVFSTHCSNCMFSPHCL